MQQETHIHGWGRYPSVNTKAYTPDTLSYCRNILQKPFNGIARGLGRSYGDSALASQTIQTTHLNHFIAFDEAEGLLTCQAGITFADIINTFLPKGWVLPVVPGTKYITVGGAIASDIHGKNHHHIGCFSCVVHSFKLLLPNGTIELCGPHTNAKLFHATCGGQGLTGIILEATIQLQKITSSNIIVKTLKTNNLEETLTLFKDHHSKPYSVAWLDCLTTGKNLGRALLMLGEHADDDVLLLPQKSNLTIPFATPSLLLNRYSISLFNTLYYEKQREQEKQSIIDYNRYFFPLDNLQHWNRLYGKAGFIQYQCVLPKAASSEGLHKILQKIAASKKGSFLSVLKLLGPQNENLLSFPLEGYTLALDFKLSSDLWPFLNELDSLVRDYSGRLYLTKDARMSVDMFHSGYPKWQQFYDLRKKIGADKVFNSRQSERLEL